MAPALRDKDHPPGARIDCPTVSRSRDYYYSLLQTVPGLLDILISQEARDKRRPARLVTGAAAAPSVRMEIFVEMQEPMPVRMAGVDKIIALPGRPSGGIRQENPAKPAIDLLRHVAQVHQF